MDMKRTTLRYIIIKMLKVKERILKSEREKQIVTYKGIPIRLSADFSKETLQARMDWQQVFKVMKSKVCNLNYSIQQSHHLEWKDR